MKYKERKHITAEKAKERVERKTSKRSPGGAKIPKSEERILYPSKVSIGKRFDAIVTRFITPKVLR